MSKDWVVPEAVSPAAPDIAGDTVDALAFVAKGRDAEGIAHDIEPEDIEPAGERHSAFIDDEPPVEDELPDYEAEALDVLEDVEGSPDEDEGPEQEAAPEAEKQQDPQQSGNRRTEKIRRLHDQVTHFQGTAKRALVAAQGYKAKSDHWMERALRAERALESEGYVLEGEHSPAVQNRLLELESEKARMAMGQEVDSWIQSRRAELDQQSQIEDAVDAIIDEHRAAAPEGMDPQYTLMLRARGDKRPPKEIWAEILGRRTQGGGAQQRAVNEAAPKPVKRKAGKRRAPRRADTRDDIDQGVDVIMRMRRT